MQKHWQAHWGRPSLNALAFASAELEGVRDARHYLVFRVGLAGVLEANIGNNLQLLRRGSSVEIRSNFNLT